MIKYNWKGRGPDGCDSHCIPHPCGPCMTGKSSKMHMERDAAYKEIAELREALEKIAKKQTCIELYPGCEKYKSYEDGWEGVAEFAKQVLRAEKK